MPSWKVIGAAVGSVLLGTMIGLSAFQPPAVRAVDEKRFVNTPACISGSRTPLCISRCGVNSAGQQAEQLVAFDESGEVRALYPTDRDRFFAGPGMAVSASIESRIEFQRDGTGKIASLTWQRDGVARVPRGASRSRNVKTSASRVAAFS